MKTFSGFYAQKHMKQINMSIHSYMSRKQIDAQFVGEVSG